jgi:hypothetical protein
MANNRMQLYCKKCLEAFALAKYYPISWGAANSQDHLNNFFEKHAKSCPADENQEMGGENMFGFRTENDEDEFITCFEPYRIKLRK